MLEAKLDNHLGYSKYDYKNKTFQIVSVVVVIKSIIRFRRI
ncbi:transposase (plasmid) [Clostridium botulinum B str. Eklund 17B (NRP)]|nr:transposase [Clostridium botulinum B str. Eklund 17B (NRP)]